MPAHKTGNVGLLDTWDPSRLRLGEASIFDQAVDFERALRCSRSGLGKPRSRTMLPLPCFTLLWHCLRVARLSKEIQERRLYSGKDEGPSLLLAQLLPISSRALAAGSRQTHLLRAATAIVANQKRRFPRSRG